MWGHTHHMAFAVPFETGLLRRLITFANETVELALAHTIKNKAEAAYRRGDQLERRRELMTAWNDYTDQHSQFKEEEYER